MGLECHVTIPDLFLKYSWTDLYKIRNICLKLYEINWINCHIYRVISASEKLDFHDFISIYFWISCTKLYDMQWSNCSRYLSLLTYSGVKSHVTSPQFCLRNMFFYRPVEIWTISVIKTTLIFTANFTPL